MRVEAKGDGEAWGAENEIALGERIGVGFLKVILVREGLGVGSAGSGFWCGLELVIMGHQWSRVIWKYQ